MHSKIVFQNRRTCIFKISRSTTVAPQFDDPSKQHWPTFTRLPGACQLLCFSTESPDDYIRLKWYRYILRPLQAQTPRCIFWCWNEELVKALSSFVRAVACYVTRR